MAQRPYTGPRGDDIPVCERCGQRHMTYQGTQSCSGHRSYETDENGARVRLPAELPCKRPPTGGLTKCQMHGGATRNAKAAGERRLAEQDAKRLMMTLGEPVPDSDPGDVIAERINARRGHVRWLHARVQALEPDALTWGLTKRKTGVARDEDDGDNTVRTFAGNDEGDTYEAKPHIWFALYNESARELERLCIEAIRVGLDERRVRVDERMADMWVRVIDGMLIDLGHDPNNPRTAEIVARHLELVA